MAEEALKELLESCLKGNPEKTKLIGELAKLCHLKAQGKLPPKALEKFDEVIKILVELIEQEQEEIGE
jgi:predicted RNase H-like HicB family nuclease